jgi:cytidyltransferase-like protein
MGGLGGHMAHLSEDLDLTFSEIIEVLGKVARAEIKNVTEKVDGQNLFLSVDDTGNFRAARSPSDIAKGGMSLDQYVAKWKGHPAEDAFMNGFRALTMALKNLDAQTLQDLFSGGERYINMEIMYPKNPNIIHYTSPQIVLHGLKYVGSQEDKEEQKRLEAAADDAFKQLVELVEAAESQVGEELWRVNGPKLVELKALADGSALERVTSKIQQIAAPVGLSATLGDLVEVYLRQYAQEAGLSDDITDKMLLLLFDTEEAKKKGITVSSLKKEVPPELKPTISKLGTKTNSKKVIISILRPLEIAVSDFAIAVLRGLKSFFVDAHDEEVVRMRQELEQSIAYLKTLADSGDPKAAELIDKQLEKLGDVENVASSMEGVVFEYPPGSGKIYKLTGAFAMANQLIGRARRSGMNEGLSKSLTINVSENHQITKTLREWIAEMKEARHIPGKVPFLVYNDLLKGALVVESVRHEDAQEVIYNTVYEYTKNFLQEAIVIELEDENEDPVTDSEFTPKRKRTIAIVPGAFKPPHQGHADMVQQYANKADKVIILISKPTKAGRYLDDKTEILQSHAEQIWRDIFLPQISGAEIEIKTDSDYASPVQAGLDYIGTQGPLDPQTTRVILGASDKPDDNGIPDWHRWKDAHTYAKPGLEIMDLEGNAVKCLHRACETPFSATTMRELISDLRENPNHPTARKQLSEFVPPNKIDELLAVFGESKAKVQEIAGNSMSGGAVGGPSGPLSTSGKKKEDPEEEESIIRHENIDFSLVEEVLELIIGRGV